MKAKIHLAILNIDSFAGQCANATHLYGTLILSEKENVTVDNVEDYNLKYLGENIEIKRELTEKIAKELDKKDGGETYLSHYKLVTENKEMVKYCGYTDRFDTIDEVVNAGIAKLKELNLDCSFISLYKGSKYHKTIIINA